VMPPPPPNWPPVPFQPPPVGAGCSNELLTLDLVELYSAGAGSVTSQKVESFRFSAVNFHYNIEVPPDTQRMRVVARSLSRREFVDIDLGSFGRVDPCMHPRPTPTAPTRSVCVAPQHIRSLAQGIDMLLRGVGGCAFSHQRTVGDPRGERAVHHGGDDGVLRISAPDRLRLPFLHSPQR
jgi:hypothetical protein